MPRHMVPVSTWRKNSRNAIIRGDVESYRLASESGDLDPLFCEVAMQVGRNIPDKLPRKELNEAWEVAKIVDRYFPKPAHEATANLSTADTGWMGQRVVELCAGCGLLAAFLILLEPARQVVCLDRKHTPLAKRLLGCLEERWPSLRGRITYQKSDLRSTASAMSGCPLGHGRNVNSEDLALPRDSLVVACHACGHLTDDAITAATADGNLRPMVLVPCCYRIEKFDFKPVGGDPLNLWRPGWSWDRWPWLRGGAVNSLGLEAVDSARTAYLQELGYKVVFDRIDPEISEYYQAFVAWPNSQAGQRDT